MGKSVLNFKLNEYNVSLNTKNKDEYEKQIIKNLEDAIKNNPPKKNINTQIMAIGFIEMINGMDILDDYKKNFIEEYSNITNFLKDFVEKNPYLKHITFNNEIKNRVIEFQKSEEFKDFDEEKKKVIEKAEQFYTVNSLVKSSNQAKEIVEGNKEWGGMKEFILKRIFQNKYSPEKEEPIASLVYLIITEKLKNDFMEKYFSKKAELQSIKQKTKDIIENLFYKVSEKLDERTTSNIDTKNLTKIISERIDILLENIRDYKINEIDSENIETDYIQEFKKLLNENLYTWNFGDKKQKGELQKIIKNLQKSESETEKEMGDFLKWLGENQKTEDKKYEISQI